MAINQNVERFDTFQLKQPAAVAITSGNLYLFGKGSHAIPGVAQTSNPASGTQPYDDNTGYFTLKCTGSVWLIVKGQTQSSPSAGAAIAPGDPVYADGGTFDPLTGVTYGSTVDGDSGGTFVGLAQDPVAAGATTTIRVILRNAC